MGSNPTVPLIIMGEEFNLSKKRTQLFNSIPFFEVGGWDRTRIADAIREQDEEFIRRLKEGSEGWDLDYPTHYEKFCKFVDELAGRKLI